MGIHNNALIGASSQGYTISRSVRLRSSASAYLNRTPASAGNRITWTWSGWIKLGSGLLLYPLDAGAGTGIGVDVERIQFGTGNGFYWQRAIIQTSTTYQFQSSAVFRDPSAWYHLVLVWDSSNATSTERMRAYVNGVRLTTSAYTAPSQNQNSLVNASTPHKINRNDDTSSSYGDGYLTEINFIDGQALTPSSFGETNSVTGVWQPKAYSGTYGTNGFYLNFSDNSAVTATTIGKDYSGNGNNWTPNNISITAGATYDSMLDVPTPYADGGNGRGNYAVLNPLFSSSASVFTLSDGNLSFSATSAATASYFSRSAFGVSSGKWYWEVTPTAVGGGPNIYIGIQDATYSPNSGTFNQAPSAYVYVYDGTKLNNATSSAYGASYTNNDVIGVALDMDSGTITFYKNNSSQGTAYTGLVGTYSPAIGLNVGGASRTITGSFNAGQRPFTYTPPTGFVALNTQNLPTPTISNGALYMAATLYTGNGSTQSITNTVNGVNFQPDMVWAKNRSNVENHQIFDSVRGVNNALYPNLTNAAGTDPGVTAFNSNGFSLGGTNNTNAQTYVGWQWNAGGTTVTNTSGTISSQVRANATAGFSIVTCTFGNGSIGHGLGVAPKMIIGKGRGPTTGNWIVFHSGLANMTDKYLNLNGTAAVATLGTAVSAPTSTLFYGNGGYLPNAESAIFYCFAAVAGYSAFGSYTGNGSADGPFVFLGFRPRFVMIKDATNASTQWTMLDSARNTYNLVDLRLIANLSNSENAQSFVDFTANGFKVRDTSITPINQSGANVIYMAFAENPFKNSLAR